MKAQNHREQVKFWHAHDLGYVELLRATYIEHTFTRHTHEGYAIGVVERGAETFYYRGQTHVAPAGSIVVINPGEVHTGQAVDKTAGWSYRMLYPEVSLVQKAAQELSRRWRAAPDFPSPVIYDSYLAKVLRNLHLVLEMSTSKLERETHFISALAQLIARHADGYQQTGKFSHPHEAVKRARQYLEDHYDQNISIKQLAQRVNLSPYHFIRVFREVTGLTPHAYLTQFRIEQAKKLLTATQPIAAVAVETGFVDQSHLNRHFKRIVGVTPGQFLLNRNNVQD